jgi:DNA-directed RNA polymerase specialized sigma24 family protein
MARAKELRRPGMIGGDARQTERILRSYRLLTHERPELAREVRQGVDALPGYQQKAVALVYFASMDQNSAAEELHCDPRTLRRWISSALRRLRFGLLLPRFLEWEKNCAARP